MRKILKPKIIIVMVAVVIASIGFGSGFYVGAATTNGAGSQNDPVVTLSYLDYRLGKLGAVEETPENNTVQSGNRTEKVTIELGERLMPGEGSIIIIYSGSCTAVGNALIDTTSAKSVREGMQVSPYSQILIPDDSSGVVAAESTVIYVLR